MPQQVAPFVAGPGEEDVERIVCASVSSIQGPASEQMESIRQAAVRNNAAYGIHAALILQAGWFVHWAEGPVASIRGLLEHTRLDKRHHSRHIVHHSHGRRLLPTPWSMMVVQSDDKAVGRRVVLLGEQMAEGRQRSPQSVIRRLVTPFRVPHVPGMADEESYHRIGMVCAAGQDASDFVAWLSQKHVAPPVKRRVSGEAKLDSATDYVDFVDHGQPCRALAIARSSLSLGLLRAYLPDWGNMLMMFSGKPATDQELMQRMVAACEGLVVSPHLIGTAPDAATHEAMLAMAEAAGLSYLPACTAPRHNYTTIWSAVSDLVQRAGPPPSSAWALSAVRLVA